MHGSIPSNIKELLFSKALYGTNASGCRIVFLDKSSNNVLYNIKEVSWQNEIGQSNSSASFSIININPSNNRDAGYYTPYRDNSPLKPKNDWYKEIVPSKRVQIQCGYADEWVNVFTGYIKSININTTNSDATIKVQCVDFLGWAGQKYISHSLPVESDPIDQYYMEYPVPLGYDQAYLTPGSLTTPKIEEVVKDLLMRAGLTSDKINIEQTYMEWEDEFEKETYANAFQKLMDKSQFVLFMDGSGNAYFQAKQNRNTTRTGTRQLDDYDYCTPFNYQIVDDINNITVTDGMGLTYTKNVDYELDIFKNAIKRKINSGISNHQIVEITYKNCDFIFKNGINVYSVDYELNHDEMYGSIYLETSAGEEWKYVQDGLLWDGSYVPIEKVKMIQNDLIEEEADQTARINREYNEMLEMYMQCQLDCVGIPWLNIYDLIQIYIYGCVREIYIIDGYNCSWNNGECRMNIKSHHYAYNSLV